MTAVRVTAEAPPRVTAPSQTMRVPVMMDILIANQLLAAAETRLAILEGHMRSGGDPEGLISRAIVDSIAGEFAIRAAFLLLDEGALEALHDANMADLSDWSESELRAAAGDR